MGRRLRRTGLGEESDFSALESTFQEAIFSKGTDFLPGDRSSQQKISSYHPEIPLIRTTVLEVIGDEWTLCIAKCRFNKCFWTAFIIFFRTNTIKEAKEHNGLLTLSTAAAYMRDT